MEEKELSHNLGETVTIKVSGEAGTVIGRADYLEAARTYLIRYKAADGRAVEAWWSGSSLQATG